MRMSNLPKTARSLRDYLNENADAWAAPAWRMPQGRHDAYMSGDVVKHDGHTWVCTYDTNIFEPPMGYELLE